MTDPKLDFQQDIGSMEPESAHDAWEEMTNLDAPALKEVKDSKRNKEYLKEAEGNQTQDNPPLPGGPLQDAITLAETPRDEWTEEHVEEAEEARNFLARSVPQFEQSEGDPLVQEDPKIHKGEMSLIRWGFDPAPRDDFP
jgi:hypothetical protein